VKPILSILLATSVLTTIAPMARAFCLEPKIRVDDEYFVSDVVFTGTITRDQKVGLTPQGFYDEDIFTWRVDRVFRGSIHPGDEVRTGSGNDSGRFPFEAAEGHQVGRHFLIFASVDPSSRKNYAVDNCGNSTLFAKAARTIREIEGLPSHRGGLLYGVMYDGDEGVRIIATGLNGKKYLTVSDYGKFTVRVSSGTYSVAAIKQGRVYADMDVAYKHAEKVTVPDGGSAGLAFREKGR